jgi:protocatechuate 3,4-dioxygenase beta subunit
MAARPPLFLVLVMVLTAPVWAQTTPAAGSRQGGVTVGRAGQRVVAPPRDRPPGRPAAAVGTSSLSGRVVSPEGTPLRRTQLTVTGSEPGARRAAFTDSDGRFAFTALPAGRYTIRANKGGYINLAYGQRTPTDPTRPIDLAEGQALAGLTIVLPRGSAITGRVIDEFGEPVLQAQVQALRYQYQPDGSRRLQPGGGSAQTDDLGQFRLYGLNPGEYVISATARNQFLPAALSQIIQVGGGGIAGSIIGPLPDQPEEEGYAPTYYPGTSNPAEAQTVTLGVAQELPVQLQLVPSRLSRISGVVADSRGRPVRSGTPVMLRSAANLAGGMNRSASTMDQGAFAITNVPPGDYYLEVRPRPVPRNIVNGKAIASDTGAEPADPEFASVPLTVGGDVSGLRIVTGTGATISGRVTFEGAPPANGLRIRVVAQSADPQRAIGIPGPNRGAQGDGVVAADGSFELTRITGPVFLRVQVENTNGPQPSQIGYMTKSVIVDGVDVADTPFDPTRRGTLSNVTVVLTDKVTGINGTVSDGGGKPLAAARVLIVPDMLPAGLSPARFQRILQSDQQGRFSLRAMPPGRYVAIAATAIDAAHQYDPALAQRVRQLGHSFSVREGETVTLDLELATDF